MFQRQGNVWFVVREVITKKKLFQLMISCVLIGIFLTWIDVRQFRSFLASADGKYLGIALGLIFVNRVLMPVKWNILLRAKKIHISWFDAIRIYFISTFLGFYLPATVGADSVRVYYARKRGYPVPDIIASIIVERVFGFLSLIFFIILGWFIFLHWFTCISFDFHRFIFISLSISAAIVAVFLVSMNNAFIRWFSAVLQKLSGLRIIGRCAAVVNNLFQSYVLYKSRKKFLLLFYALTCIEMVLPIIRSYIIAMAFGISIPLSYYFAFVPIVLFLIRLPVSIDGFGIHEGGFVYFLSLMGVSETMGFGVGVVSHFFLLISHLPGIIFYILEKYQDDGIVYQQIDVPDRQVPGTSSGS